jgi:hypothetical protein
MASATALQKQYGAAKEAVAHKEILNAFSEQGISWYKIREASANVKAIQAKHKTALRAPQSHRGQLAFIAIAALPLQLDQQWRRTTRPPSPCHFFAHNFQPKDFSCLSVLSCFHRSLSSLSSCACSLRPELFIK